MFTKTNLVGEVGFPLHYCILMLPMDFGRLAYHHPSILQELHAPLMKNFWEGIGVGFALSHRVFSRELKLLLGSLASL